MRKVFATLFLACVMVGGGRSLAAEQAVTYTRIGSGEYQNFVMNWDTEKNPVLCALIQTPDQYNAVFHPAPSMGDKRPFAPGPELYEKEQILVVARVMTAIKHGDEDKVFEVQRLVTNGEALELHYRFNEPTDKATWFVKNWLVLRIPKHEYKKVVLFENDKQLLELDLAKGQWSIPTRPPADK